VGGDHHIHFANSHSIADKLVTDIRVLVSRVAVPWQYANNLQKPSYAKMQTMISR
jgi:hypothetical protein